MRNAAAMLSKMTIFGLLLVGQRAAIADQTIFKLRFTKSLSKAAVNSIALAEQRHAKKQLVQGARASISLRMSKSIPLPMPDDSDNPNPNSVALEPRRPVDENSDTAIQHSASAGTVRGRIGLAPSRWDPILIAIQDRKFEQAELQLMQQLAQDSRSDETRFLLARVLSWQGKYYESAQRYHELLQKEPDNCDYLLGEAQVRVWSGDPGSALPILERAEKLSPGYLDIWRLHLQALFAMGNSSSRLNAAQLQDELTQRVPEASWEMAAAQPVQPANPVLAASQSNNYPGIQDALDRNFVEEHDNALEAGYGFDHLSRGYGTWQSRYLTFEHRFAPRKIVYATLQDTERFRIGDQQLVVGGYYPLAQGPTLNLEGNASATHRMLPLNSEMASLQFPLSSGWFLTGGMRRIQYNASRSLQEFGILEWYFGDFRAAYTLTNSQALGTHMVGHRINLSRYYNESSYVTATLSRGREGELDHGNKLFSHTQYFGLNGRHWFNQDWAVVWSVGTTEQGSAYIRNGVGLGLRRSF